MNYNSSDVLIFKALSLDVCEEKEVNYIVLVCMCISRFSTHISTREGGEELELVEGVSLGGHEVEEDLELTAAQETPFQKLATWCADSQFADLLS